MIKYNAQNERMKREYARFKRDADSKDNKTVDAIGVSIARYESYTKLKDFGSFNKNQAIAFKAHLADHLSPITEKPLALATQLSTLKDLQGFFKWLAYQPGYKAKIHMPDIAYLNMGDRKTRVAKSSGAVAYPSLEQVRHVIAQMPVTTDLEKRDRALIAILMLTGVRDSALISLKLKHFDTHRLLVSQDPREVKTKNGKWIETYFFPVAPDLTEIVLEWVNYLQLTKLFGPTDPIFPKTQNAQDANQQFAVAGLSREHWQGAQAVRNIFKAAFERAGLKYYHPHSLRHTLGHIGQKVCRTPEEMKAWSQNLGHEGVMTTLTSYGHMTPHRQGEVIQGLGQAKPNDDVLAQMRELLARAS